MTFVVQSCSTSLIKTDTLEPSGKYTSKSPFTFIEDSSLQKEGLKPSLQSIAPECIVKKPVTNKHKTTVKTGSLTRACVPDNPDKDLLTVFGA